MGTRKRSLEAEARDIFGAEDQESVRRWVEYWRRSEERNQTLLDSFASLALLDFDGRSVLDVGCGTGGLGKVIGDRCRLYLGADYNRHVLQFAASDPPREYLQCTGVALPFKNESFDYIFAFDVIEHVEGGEEMQVRFLAELSRVLRPFGMILLTTPNRWSPFEGHSRMYFPQYLPTRLADLYIRFVNPGFLKEHNTFAEIHLMSPRQLGRALSKNGLTFLHDLPCALDRREFLKNAPFPGVTAYLGLGWYPHAEFWGIVVKSSVRQILRRKLRRTWFYEKNQPSSAVSGFAPRVDFRQDAWGYQLGAGWYWHERSETPCRWMGKRAVCYLESPSGSPAGFVEVEGYSPISNRLEVRACLQPGKSILLGEHFCREQENFKVRYLLPFHRTAGVVMEIELSFDRTFSPQEAGDKRDLSVMIYRVELVCRNDTSPAEPS